MKRWREREREGKREREKKRERTREYTPIDKLFLCVHVQTARSMSTAC